MINEFFKSLLSFSEDMAFPCLFLPRQPRRNNSSCSSHVTGKSPVPLWRDRRGPCLPAGRKEHSIKEISFPGSPAPARGASKIAIIPLSPFRRDDFVADGYLLFFFPHALNFDLFQTTIFLPLVQCNYHFNLHASFYADTKKPAKKSFRVLAGIYDKPKRLCATQFIIT